MPSHRPHAFVVLRARLEAAAGNHAVARRLLADHPDLPAPVRVMIHLALGDHDRAFDLLDRAVSEKNLTFCSWVNPEMDPLRSDPGSHGSWPEWACRSTDSSTSDARFPLPREGGPQLRSSGAGPSWLP